ncbi:glycosyltransferase family 4 protein [Streptomyces sp. TRM66268-LWL]|uniref:Glycosyltransferase family 4 protein n=1 Tax=Streptomyces polyasparticus TaxID=2767826 RepID=A0ABR7SVT3_9ACTN|nr:glycosyltransferase family 4 protein [Streptomyces polyasparticus]
MFKIGSSRPKVSTALPASGDPVAGRRRPQVLHVSESWGGGVISAVADYLEVTPEYDHWLLVAAPANVDTQQPLPSNLVGTLRMPAGHLQRIRAISSAYSLIQPDIVHAHSSYAGFYVRSCLTVPSVKIAYTPHCYAFERRDLSRAARTAAEWAEKVLAHRTGIVAAVSPRESILARSLRSDQQVWYVPNRAPVNSVCASNSTAGVPRIVTVGRISPQKDPAFFADAARAASAMGGKSKWIWVGGGDEHAQELLRTAGVEVTGWLPRSEALALLGSATTYVHTAAWEGAPLSVIEAAQAGLVVVARSIPALESLSLPNLARSPVELAKTALRLTEVSSEEASEERRVHLRAVRTALRDCSAENQGRRLREIYELMAGLKNDGSQIHAVDAT